MISIFVEVVLPVVGRRMFAIRPDMKIPAMLEVSGVADTGA